MPESAGCGKAIMITLVVVSIILIGLVVGLYFLPSGRSFVQKQCAKFPLNCELGAKVKDGKCELSNLIDTGDKGLKCFASGVGTTAAASAVPNYTQDDFNKDYYGKAPEWSKNPVGRVMYDQEVRRIKKTCGFTEPVAPKPT